MPEDVGVRWAANRPDRGARASARRSTRSQRPRKPALTGVSGGTLGYPWASGRPSAGRYEPAWTPNGSHTANGRRITALQGAERQIGAVTAFTLLLLARAASNATGDW